MKKHLFLISYYILVICMLKMNKFLLDTHSLFKREFPPSFVNLKNEITAPGVNLWLHSIGSCQISHENFISNENQVLCQFWKWKYTAFTYLGSNYIRNRCRKSHLSAVIGGWLVSSNFQRKNPTSFPTLHFKISLLQQLKNGRKCNKIRIRM